MTPLPPRSTLFPYTTLFRSVLDEGGVIGDGVLAGIQEPVALVGVAEKGFVTIELTARTAGGHSSLPPAQDRKSTRLNSSHSQISYAVFCLKKKKTRRTWSAK